MWCSCDHHASRSIVPKVVLWLPKHVIPESVGCFKSPAGHRIYLPAGKPALTVSAAAKCVSNREATVGLPSFEIARVARSSAMKTCNSACGTYFPLLVNFFTASAEFVGVHAVDDGVALGVELLLDRGCEARAGSAPWWQRWPAGAFCASRCASSRVAAFSSAAGTTLTTRPQSYGLGGRKAVLGEKDLQGPPRCRRRQPRRRCRRHRVIRRVSRRPA